MTLIKTLHERSGTENLKEHITKAACELQSKTHFSDN